MTIILIAYEGELHIHVREGSLSEPVLIIRLASGKNN